MTISFDWPRGAAEPVIILSVRDRETGQRDAIRMTLGEAQRIVRELDSAIEDAERSIVQRGVRAKRIGGG